MGLLCGMWDLPGLEIEPVYPALASGFLTAVPPGKSILDDFEHIRSELSESSYFVLRMQNIAFCKSY